MRRTDWETALAVRDQWKDGQTTRPCQVFATPDALVKTIVSLRIYPGTAIAVCPSCGQEHRWALIRQLMVFACDAVPRGKSRVLDAFYNETAEEREDYGGDDGYRKMRRDAEAYFAKHPAADIYVR